MSVICNLALVFIFYASNVVCKYLVVTVVFLLRQESVIFRVLKICPFNCICLYLVRLRISTYCWIWKISYSFCLLVVFLLLHVTQWTILFLIISFFWTNVEFKVVYFRLFIFIMKINISVFEEVELLLWVKHCTHCLDLDLNDQKTRCDFRQWLHILKNK